MVKVFNLVPDFNGPIAKGEVVTYWLTCKHFEVTINADYTGGAANYVVNFCGCNKFFELVLHMYGIPYQYEAGECSDHFYFIEKGWFNVVVG